MSGFIMVQWPTSWRVSPQETSIEVRGCSTDITVSTSGIGTVVPFGILSAWIDFNRDGDWADVGERILTNVSLNPSVLDPNGNITFANLAVPIWAVPGDTYARFRLSTTSGLGVSGQADAGEVEDHRIVILANPWQNSPNPYDVNNDGGVSPIDALLLINYINAGHGGAVPPVLPGETPPPPYYDVNGDGVITAQDVLVVINQLNDASGTSGGERSVHHHPFPDLYRAAIDASFPAFCLPRGDRPPMLALVPPHVDVLQRLLVEQQPTLEDRLLAAGEGEHRAVAGVVDGDVEHHQVADRLQPGGEVVDERRVAAFADVGDDGNQLAHGLTS